MIVKVENLKPIKKSRILVADLPAQEVLDPDMEILKPMVLKIEEVQYLEQGIFDSPTEYSVSFYLFDLNERDERYYVGVGYNLDEAVDDLLWFIYEELELLTEREKDLSDFMMKVKNKLSTYVRI